MGDCSVGLQSLLSLIILTVLYSSLTYASSSGLLMEVLRWCSTPRCKVILVKRLLIVAWLFMLVDSTALGSVVNHLRSSALLADADS